MCASRSIPFLGLVAMSGFFVSAQISAEPSVDLGTLSKQLERFPLKSEGENFLKWGAKYQVDPRLIVAIAGAETTYGKNLCADFNAWNWFFAGSCAPSDFASFDRGIEIVSKFMRKSYFLAGYTTVEQIQTKYCASGCEHWVPNVMKFYRDEMGGNPGDLTYSHAFTPAARNVATENKVTPPVPDDEKTEVTPSKTEATPSWFSRYGTTLLVTLLALVGAGASAVALFLLIRRAGPTRKGIATTVASGEFAATPPLIPAGNAQTVTLLFRPPREGVQPTSASVVRVDSKTVPVGVVGNMNPGADGTYSMQVTLSETTLGAALFQVWIQYPATQGTGAATVASEIAAVGIFPPKLKLGLPRGWRVAPTTEEFRLNSTAGTGAVTVSEASPSESLDSFIIREHSERPSPNIERVLGGTLVQSTGKDGLTWTTFYAQNGPRILRFRLIHDANDPRAQEYRGGFDSLLSNLRFDA
jgi:hypothetical protein